jgi:hypothetical protein
MLKNITLCILMLFGAVFNLHAQTALSTQALTLMKQILEQQGLNFAALEHRYLGNSVYLKFTPSDLGVQGIKLALPNGLLLSYGEILMFGGDLFGDPKNPISSCKLASKEECFEKQFARLGIQSTDNPKDCSNPATQVKNINSFYKNIEQQLEAAREEGIDDSVFYSKIAGKINKAMNRATCGGSIFTDYLPFGSYLSLAQVNFDHFVPDSLSAYQTGHKIALQLAIEAHEVLNKEHDREKATKLLMLAYAKNAFASHFLSDSMSSGHLRTPRRELHQQVSLPAILKLLLANYMHDEDNKYGLEVTNPIGLTWRAFGDGHLFDENASMHRYLLNKVIQLSADSIFEAYITGTMPKHLPEFDYIPDVSKIEQLNTSAPLFKLDDNNKVLRRAKINDRYSNEWQSHWNGLATLVELKLFYEK